MIQVQVKFDYSLKTLMKWPNFHFASSGKRPLKLLSMQYLGTYTYIDWIKYCADNIGWF